MSDRKTIQVYADDWDAIHDKIEHLCAREAELLAELERVKAERDSYEHKWRTDAWD